VATVHLAAGVLFADGGRLLARQLKGLEYGCSADAVVRLSGALAPERAVALLVQADQFGNQKGNHRPQQRRTKREAKEHATPLKTQIAGQAPDANTA
jgi:hypothetical protein